MEPGSKGSFLRPQIDLSMDELVEKPGVANRPMTAGLVLTILDYEFAER